MDVIRSFDSVNFVQDDRNGIMTKKTAGRQRQQHGRGRRANLLAKLKNMNFKRKKE